MILFCATGGNKNEHNKRTMARKHSTRGRYQKSLPGNEAANGVYGTASQGLDRKHDRRAKSDL